MKELYTTEQERERFKKKLEKVEYQLGSYDRLGRYDLNCEEIEKLLACSNIDEHCLFQYTDEIWHIMTYSFEYGFSKGQRSEKNKTKRASSMR